MYIIMRCILFRYIYIYYIYTYNTRRSHIVRTLLLKTTAFEGVSGVDVAKKKARCRRRAQSSACQSSIDGAMESVVERVVGSRYESRARNVSGCQVLMMINELGSRVVCGGVRCARNTTRIYFYGAFFFLALNSLYIESDYVREFRSPAARAVLCLRVPLNATKFP